MNLRDVPAPVRARLVLYWVGMALAGSGVVGFFLSFRQVASPAQAATDVHDVLPVLAYVAILLWAGGLALMWYARRWLDRATHRKLRENRVAAVVDLGEGVAADDSDT